MLDRDTLRILGLFGDAKEHHMFEVIKLGTILLKGTERETEKFFKKFLEYGWVNRQWKSYEPRTDYYTLTSKGDELFRKAQLARVARTGDDTDETRDHYRNFDRSSTGKYGVAGMGKAITERSAGLH